MILHMAFRYRYAQIVTWLRSNVKSVVQEALHTAFIRKLKTHQSALRSKINILGVEGQSSKDVDAWFPQVNQAAEKTVHQAWI